MNRPDTETIADVCCPKCKEQISESTDRYCRCCGEPLISLHTQCVNCSFSSIDAMTRGPHNGCPMCGHDWPSAEVRDLRGCFPGARPTKQTICFHIGKIELPSKEAASEFISALKTMADRFNCPEFGYK